jgi:hypothetical protein
LKHTTHRLLKLLRLMLLPLLLQRLLLSLQAPRSRRCRSAGQRMMQQQHSSKHSA